MARIKAKKPRNGKKNKSMNATSPSKGQCLKNALSKKLITEQDIENGIGSKKARKLNDKANSMGSLGVTKKAEIARRKYGH